VATVISEADFPDIIHLSEVESCAALARLAHLVDVLHKKKYDGVTSGYRFYLIPGKDTATGKYSSHSSLFHFIVIIIVVYLF